MRDKIEAESGIEKPNRTGGADSKYPWKTMDVGQSFLVPSGLKITSFRAARGHAERTTGRKFSTRTMPDGTYRCWRDA